jgi:uncharacterized membrane protein YphA (DoxX/SURF4 family)
VVQIGPHALLPESGSYATGVDFVAAGVAILTGVQARLAAILMTAMLVSFRVLANVRILMADHSSRPRSVL